MKNVVSNLFSIRVCKQTNYEVILFPLASGNSRSGDILTWTNGDVIDWLKENKLIRSVDIIEST